MVDVKNLAELKEYLSTKNADVNFFIESDDKELVSYLPLFHGPIDKYVNEGKLKVDCKSWVTKEIFKGTVNKK